MTETGKKPTLGRKIFIASALSLVLIGLPAVSWLYLRDGLNWRKEALKELGSYGQIPQATIHWGDGTMEDRLNGKVVVAHLFGDNADLTADNRKIVDTGQQLFDQFGSNLNFRITMIAASPTAEFRSYTQKMPSYDFATWVWIPGHGNWPTVLKNGFESYYVRNKISAYPHYYALTDTSGVIRRFYNAMDEKEVGRMVEQIAILLPQQ